MSVSRKSVFEVFRSHPSKAFRIAEIVNLSGAGKRERGEVREILQGLIREGRLVTAPGRRFALPAAAAVTAARSAKPRRSSKPAAAPAAAGRADRRLAPGMAIGRLSVHRRGFGFVRREVDGSTESAEGLPDVHVPHALLGEALHGDQVLIQVSRDADPKRPDGRVLSVVQRGLKQLVGRFHRLGRRGGLVVPRDQRLGRNVYVVAPPPADELPDGAWVTVRLVEYPAPPDDLIGEVIETLGDDQTPGIDILLVLRDYGIEQGFPAAVEEEVARLPAEVAAADLAGRNDLRGRMTFTIDGYDAKDFDDALSIERRDGGGFRLFVHIADVAHYVQPGAAVDAEALRRSTSIYPIDRVVPMLPEALSNNLCSLVPNKDRLTLTVEMELTKAGAVEDYRLYESAIQSQFRLNYRDVQSFYDGIDNPATARLKKIADDLNALLELKDILRTRRLKRGALDLDLPEIEIEFDETGMIENVVRAPRWESHQVIEECMILANEVVARHLRGAGAPLLYRVHDEPTREDIDRAGAMLAPYGIHLSSRSKKPVAAQIQEALGKAAGFDAPHIFNRLILRSLAQARYHPDNTGHFGLASPCYTHFTSPIRRYPDLLVHRALKEVLRKGKPARDWVAQWTQKLPSLGGHCSDLERRANDIETEATRICSLEFMRRRVGESFEGNVAGIVNHGLHVELRRYPVEGFLHVRDLHDDRYEFHEATMTLRGRRAGRVFRLGQRVEVIVHRVDVLTQEMDLRLALLEEQHPRRGGKLYQSRVRHAW